jgi:hypothetical protein
MDTTEALHFNLAGWYYLPYDNCPRVHECDEPLASGQRKLWLKSRSTALAPKALHPNHLPCPAKAGLGHEQELRKVPCLPGSLVLLMCGCVQASP